MQSLFDQTEHWVEESFKDSPATVRHLKRTVEWIRKLRPSADEALLVAAVAHDIERSDRGPDHAATGSFTDPEYLRHHQERGAEMLRHFLLNHGGSTELADRVAHLVEKHEIGGDLDQNLLKDADSMSFFDTQIERFLTTKAGESGSEAVAEKLQFMLDRISDSKLKEQARPKVDEALRRLQSGQN